MYGVPEHLDLSHFKGRVLVQIAFGEHQLQFRFDPEGAFLVEGDWTLSDSSRQIIDRATDNESRDAYRVHRLLGRKIKLVHVMPPKSVELEFEDGCRLCFIDSSDEYESFSIEPDGVVV